LRHYIQYFVVVVVDHGIMADSAKTAIDAAKSALRRRRELVQKIKTSKITDETIVVVSELQRLLRTVKIPSSAVRPKEVDPYLRRRVLENLLASNMPMDSSEFHRLLDVELSQPCSHAMVESMLRLLRDQGMSSLI
jgi:hypothetical protein